jgi:hypothetical protein
MIAADDAPRAPPPRRSSTGEDPPAAVLARLNNAVAAGGGGGATKHREKALVGKGMRWLLATGSAAAATGGHYLLELADRKAKFVTGARP